MTINLGLIGCGGIARRHLQAMQDLRARERGDFQVTAVCDANVAAAEELADQCGTLFGVRPTVFADHHAMIAAGNVDGVDLCLPHGLHHGISIDCMEAGLHVLCEKPLGITIKACRQMAETADRTGTILSTAAPHRRLPGQRVAHWIFNESNLIGKPLSFFHQYRRAPDPTPAGNTAVPERVRWRQDKLMSGGGPVLDSGFHYCDSIRYFFGDVDTVYAQLRSLKTGTPLPFTDAPEDTTFVTFTFKSGVVGTWTWSLAAPGDTAYDVTFYGSEGSLQDTTAGRFSIFHLFERRPDQQETGRVLLADGTEYDMPQLEQMHRASLGAEAEEHLYPGGTTDGFAIEIWEFLELLRGNLKKPEIDGWEGLRSLAVGEAIYESALTGEVIRVDDIISGARSRFQDPIDAHWNLT